MQFLGRKGIAPPQCFARPACLAMLFAAVVGHGAAAGMRENFESPEVSWVFAASDAAHHLDVHERLQTQAHWGHGCEHLRIATGPGTHLYYSHDIGQPRVIEELKASVWVKGDRPGVQLLARVVFPRAVDSRTQHPVTALISGSTYRNPGGWQCLTIENIPKLVEEQARVLRLQLGRDVDPREAYLDMVLLNTYCGKGVIELLIDDLEVEGFVPVKSSMTQPATTNVQAAQFQSNVDAPSTEVDIRGAVLLVGGQPLFPRIIEHRGESFEFLRRLGFNTVRVAAPPTPWQVSEARRHDMWLIGPPPDVRSGRSIGPAHDRVLAWDLGRDRDARNLASVRDLAFAVRRADEQTGRPLLVEADEQLRAYSRIANVMLLEREVLGTSFEMADYGPWFGARQRLLRPGTPAWATIQTQPPELPGEAANSAATASANVDPQQIRLLTLSAVAAGARALVFTSRSRLDGEDEASLRRAEALELVNRELDLIEPWLAVCSHATPLQVGEAGVSAAMFSSQHSQLILLTQIGTGSQHVLKPPGVQRLSLVVPGIPESSDAYLLSPTGLRPLPHRRVTGGIGVAVEQMEWASAVVFTTDPLIYARLSQTVQQSRARVAQLQLGTVVELLQRTKPVLAAGSTSPRSSGEAASALALIEANLSQGQRMLSAGDASAASTYAGRASVSLAQLRRNLWEKNDAADPIFRSPLERAFVSPDDPRAVWIERLAAEHQSPGANHITGGNMENLQELSQRGWRNFHRQQYGVSTQVELSPVRPNTGQFSLRLEATRAGEDALAHVESPPIWIRSPSVTVRPGQPYEIHGWIRMEAPLAGTLDGVMIHDTIQGRDLAIRVPHSRGWQAFTLRGVAVRQQPLALNIELTGLGEAFIDDVEIVLPGEDHAPTGEKASSTATRLRDLIRLPR